MINNELEKIVADEKTKGSSNMYIRNVLKEFLQAYVLYYIYTQKEYSKNLIFTGGTCLRHFYELPRLSEDLDFDYLEDFDSGNLLKDIREYFEKKLKYRRIKLSLKQRGEQIILKFPVLHSLSLATKQESDLLYIKCLAVPAGVAGSLFLAGVFYVLKYLFKNHLVTLLIVFGSVGFIFVNLFVARLVIKFLKKREV